MVVFKSTQMKFEVDIKAKLYDKMTYLTESVKCLRLKIDKSHLSFELNRSNSLIFNMTKYVNTTISRSMHFTIFDPHVIYNSHIWNQNTSNIHQTSSIVLKLYLRSHSRSNCTAYLSVLLYTNLIVLFNLATSCRRFLLLFYQIMKYIY